jgi:hypothetical protein
MAVSGSLRFIGGFALALMGITIQHEKPMIMKTIDKAAV